MTDVNDNDWYVLEVPHRGNPTAFRCYGREDFISRHHAAADQKLIDGCIFQKTTVRDLASDFGSKEETITDDIEDEPFLEEVARLAQAHGWDAALYRADYARVEGEYSPEPIDELDAVSAWASHDLSGWYLCQSEAEVLQTVATLEGEHAPRVGQCGPVRAAMALRKAAGLQTNTETEDEE